MNYDRTFNFSAGPAMMPEPVLEEIRDEMMNYRGSGMSADANGVMVYKDLAAYRHESARNVALSTDYGTVGPNATNSANKGVDASYAECPVLYADYAVYYDESIEGNTVKIRYGLSMMDSVEYIDADGNVVKGDKSPIELSASYKNDAYPDYNAGYGMVYDEDGNLEYTTRYYEEKAILFYIINHSFYNQSSYSTLNTNSTRKFSSNNTEIMFSNI